MTAEHILHPPLHHIDGDGVVVCAWSHIVAEGVTA
jgi:hypothetical protein